jgi:hypothetical protein
VQTVETRRVIVASRKQLPIHADCVIPEITSKIDNQRFRKQFPNQAYVNEIIWVFINRSDNPSW